MYSGESRFFVAFDNHANFERTIFLNKLRFLKS